MAPLTRLHHHLPPLPAAFPPLHPRRFSPSEDVASTVPMKSSAVRGVKKEITDLYPNIEPYIDDIVPKKDSVMEARG